MRLHHRTVIFVFLLWDLKDMECRIRLFAVMFLHGSVFGLEIIGRKIQMEMERLMKKMIRSR